MQLVFALYLSNCISQSVTFQKNVFKWFTFKFFECLYEMTKGKQIWGLQPFMKTFSKTYNIKLKKRT